MFDRRRVLIAAASKSKGHNLPAEYQEVEYLESTGTQYIDTGVLPFTTLNTKVILSAQQRGYVFGSAFQPNIDYYGVNFLNDYTMELYYGSAPFAQTSSWTTDEIMTIEIRNGTFYKNGSEIHQYNLQTFNSNKVITLFALNYTRIVYSYARIYYFMFYNDTEKLREFIPCYRKSDNVAGMYDLVNDVFYTNAGTGTFIVGADVN